MNFRLFSEFHLFFSSGFVPLACGRRWSTWLQNFEYYLVATNITAERRKKASLLFYAGPKVQEVFEGVREETRDYSYEETRDLLPRQFKPRVNKESELLRFRRTKQESSETMDSYYRRLEILAENCQFNDKKEEIKSQIIQTCASSQLRRKVLEMETCALENILDMARRMEAAEKHIREIELEASSSIINNINSGAERKFWKCGEQFPHVGQCKAKNSTCYSCKKKGHFTRLCRKTNGNRTNSDTNDKRRRKINILDSKENQSEDNSQSEESDDENIYTITTNATVYCEGKQPKANVTVEGHKIQMLIDTGSNIKLYQKYFSQLSLKPAEFSAFSYANKSPLKITGYFTAKIQCEEKIRMDKIYIIEGAKNSLLSFESARDLNMITLNCRQVLVDGLSDDSNIIIEKNKKLFQGIGKLKGVKVNQSICDASNCS